MNKYIKFIFVVFIFTLIFIDMSTVSAGENTGPTVRMKLENCEYDKNLKEIVISVRNKSDERIKIKEIVLEKKTGGVWEELPRRKNVDFKRNVTIHPKQTGYDSLLVGRMYNLKEDILEYGKYRIRFSFQYQGKRYEKSRFFAINPDNTYKGENLVAYAPVSNTGTYEKPEKISQTQAVLLNHDFRIDSHGNVTAIIFSENSYYDKIQKTKIKIKIQRKERNHWKNYKKYSIVKKSNIAYANKKFKVRKSGTYRMKIEIIVYKKNKKPKIKTYKSFCQKYRK